MNTSIFICTHGRPNAQYTLEALRNAGYHGRIILVTDDEDKTYNDYFINYGNGNTYNAELLQFDKQHYIDYIDTGVLEPKRKAILYAKCACEDSAKILGLDAFVIADDDLTGFRYRYEDGDTLKSLQITQNLDKIINSYYQFILDYGVCATAFGTNQMFMGGKISDERKGDFRVPYNFVIRNASIPFSWVSEMYEDTISPILENQRGHYTLQLPFVKLEMMELTAGANGGMTETYNQMSIHERIFQIVKYAPTTVKYIATHDKITHSILKDKAYPKLISSFYKKTS